MQKIVIDAAKPCKHGHAPKRYQSTGKCVECVAEAGRKRYYSGQQKVLGAEVGLHAVQYLLSLAQIAAVDLFVEHLTDRAASQFVKQQEEAS